MNKAQELFDILDRYYDDLPNAQIGYLQGVIRGLADNCPDGDRLLERHIKGMKRCEREMEIYRQESVAA
jgi:hypothetical protein